MSQRPHRSDAPIELTWNLADLFLNDETWSNEIESILADLDTVTQYEGRLGESAAVLRSCLEAQEKLHERLTLVTAFASLRESEDSTNPVNQANSVRVQSVRAKVNSALSFIPSELLALPDGTIEGYLKDTEGLAPFTKNLLDLLENKPYQLSPETEKALASLGQVFYGPYLIYQRSKLSDMQFESVADSQGVPHNVSFALYEDVYEFSTDTTLRRNASKAFAKGLHAYKNTFAATYSTEISRQVTLAKLRGFKSTTDMLLHPQQVSHDMYNHLLDVIFKELSPHMRRLATLRKRLFGLDEMRHCDLKIPLDPDFNPHTTIEEATKLILESVQILGPEYCANIEKAISDRWIDYVDNVGKSTGAFCSSPYGAHSYILITWGDTMRSAFVLAHELGHAGHFSLANQYQRIGNTRPSMYFVEAPSTMNEMLLADHILKNTTDPRMRRWVISQLLGTYYHNFVTHLLEGHLQRRIYTLADRGVPITAKVLSEEKHALLSSFWGDSVHIDDDASLTWMRQPHYYMGLYPYTYSAGLTASTLIAEQIRKDGSTTANRWVEVLKAGGTKKPLDLMKMAGVDMSSPEPISKAVAYVGKLVEELETSFTEDLALRG